MGEIRGGENISSPFTAVQPVLPAGIGVSSHWQLTCLFEDMPYPWQILNGRPADTDAGGHRPTPPTSCVRPLVCTVSSWTFSRLSIPIYCFHVPDTSSTITTTLHAQNEVH